jgi:precorrin-2 dehydrogenase/sirohydrochlorin ferrochelatase
MSKYHPDFQTRRRLWYEIIDSDVLHFFREDSIAKAHQRTAEIVGDEVVNKALEE